MKNLERANQIRRVRNEMKRMMKENKCHLEVGTNVLSGPQFYLCPDEPHDIELDDDVQSLNQPNKIVEHGQLVIKITKPE